MEQRLTHTPELNSFKLGHAENFLQSAVSANRITAATRSSHFSVPQVSEHSSQSPGEARPGLGAS